MSVEQTFFVKAQNGKYLIDGDVAPNLELISGKTYEFNLSDPSLSSHPLEFKLNGNSWDDGVQYSGTLGINQTVTLTVPDTSDGTVSYYCSNHSGMGNDLSLIANQIVGTEANDVLNGSSGTDMIWGSEGTDTINGGPNVYDVVTYEILDEGVIVNYSADPAGLNNQYKAFTAYKAETDTDTLSNVSDFHSTYRDDTLFLDSELVGYAHLRSGNDTIFVSGGQELQVYPGSGDDSIQGNGSTSIFYRDDGYDVQGSKGRQTQTNGISVELSGIGTGLVLNDSWGGQDDFSGVSKIYGSHLDDEITGSSGDDWFEGGDRNDTLDGGDGNDWLAGEDGDDTITGGDGDDTLTGGDGDDSLYGGFGTDDVFGGNGNDLIIHNHNAVNADGGAGEDTFQIDLSDETYEQQLKDLNVGIEVDFVQGTSRAFNLVTGDYFGAGDDTLINIENFEIIGSIPVTVQGNEVANKLYGGDGNDTISGGAGDDTLTGGDGNDTLNGDAGKDVVKGGAGNDTIINGSGFNYNYAGGGGEDYYDGGDGIDTLITGMIGGSWYGDYIDEIDLASGSAGGKGSDFQRDVLLNIENVTYVGALDAEIIGDDKSNTLLSNTGNDFLNGGDGDDTLDGGTGDDTLIGGGGNDTLDGGDGDDTLLGGDGDDVYEYWGYQGFDVISETSGFDKIIFKDGHRDNAGWGSPFREGNDLVYIAQNELSGFRVQDHFLNPKNSIEQFEYEISGYSVLVRNSDTPIESDTSSELLVGTSQNDTLIGADSAVGPHTEFYAYAGDDVIDNSNGTKSWIEAGAGDDTLIGGIAEDRMRGQLGKDTLYGNDGNDFLFGGAGDDTLSGGLGSDTFIFDAGFGNDIITDFTHGLDELKFYGANGELLSATDIIENQNSEGDTVLRISDGPIGINISDTAHNVILPLDHGGFVLLYETETSSQTAFYTSTGTVINSVETNDQNGNGLQLSDDGYIVVNDLEHYNHMGVLVKTETYPPSSPSERLSSVAGQRLKEYTQTDNFYVYNNEGSLKVLNNQGEPHSFPAETIPININYSAAGLSTFILDEDIENNILLQALYEDYFLLIQTGSDADGRSPIGEFILGQVFAIETDANGLASSINPIGQAFSINRGATQDRTIDVQQATENQFFLVYSAKSDSLTPTEQSSGLSGQNVRVQLIDVKDGLKGDYFRLSSPSNVPGIDNDETNALVTRLADNNIAVVWNGYGIYSDEGYYSYETYFQTFAQGSVTLSGVSVYSLPFSIVSEKSGDNVTVSFYLDPDQDPADAGVGSFNATVGFEPNSLTYVSSSFADGLTGVPNTTEVDSGTLGLGGFGLTPVTDLATALFSVTFDANGTSEPVQLTLSEVEVDATSLSGGTYTFDLTGATLSGSIVTRSGTALPEVVLATDTGLSAQTSSSGAFEMDLSGSEQLLSGSLSFSNTGFTKAISAADALDALKLSVGLSTDAGVGDAFSLISADFDQNGRVTAADALEILKYSVGLTAQQDAKWVFVDTAGDYSDISKSNTSYTDGMSIADLSADTSVSLTGILIGDVNDSYSGLIA